MRVRKTLIYAAWLISSGAAYAATMAITDIEGGRRYDSFHSGSRGDVIGWDFKTDQSLAVRSVALWNDGALNGDHRIGIWDASGASVFSTTIGPRTARSGGDWWLSDVEGLTLGPGTYTIGALYSFDDWDQYLSGPSSIILSDEIALIQSRFPSSPDLGFSFPQGRSTTLGRFGPSFSFDTIASGTDSALAPVPAPASGLSLGGAIFGAFGLAAWRRRRRAERT